MLFETAMHNGISIGMSLSILSYRRTYRSLIEEKGRSQVRVRVWESKETNPNCPKEGMGNSGEDGSHGSSSVGGEF